MVQLFDGNGVFQQLRDAPHTCASNGTVFHPLPSGSE